MAFKDSSGRITIDEYAAMQDIQKINQAKTALETSKKALESIINQAASEQGQTATAIAEKADELRKQAGSIIGSLSETASYISYVVAHYREIDRQLKEAVQNASKIIETVGTSATTPSLPTIAIFNDSEKSKSALDKLS